MNERVRMKMLLAGTSSTGNRLKAFSDAASPNVYDGAFEFSGRRLSAPPARGLYIENGQKRVAK